LPEAYRDGVFVAFHGSRFEPNAPVGDEPGYSVDFVPFEEGAVTGERRRFATGFAGEGRPLPEAAAHRPVGLATAPDGALLVTDDWGGRVWRITATE
jgi:glucose/arabinose dehydrogenase